MSDFITCAIVVPSYSNKSYGSRSWEIVSNGPLFTNRYNKLGDPFFEGGIHFILPLSTWILYRAKILHSPSVARRSKTKRDIEFKCEGPKKMNFSRNYGSPSELYLLVNIVLCLPLSHISKFETNLTHVSKTWYLNKISYQIQQHSV